MAPASQPHANRKDDAIPKAPALATRGVTGGIADDQPAALADPRLRALGLRQARVTVSWDLAVRGPRPGAAPDAARFPALADEHRRLQTWLAEARRAGLSRILVAIRSSRGSGGTAPSRERYRAAVRSLLRWLDRIGYGKSIEAVSAWNEPNLSGATRARPEIAAGYFDDVRSLCAARGCTAVAGEFADRPADARCFAATRPRSRRRRRQSGDGTPTRTAGTAARTTRCRACARCSGSSRPRPRSGSPSRAGSFAATSRATTAARSRASRPPPPISVSCSRPPRPPIAGSGATTSTSGVASRLRAGTAA